MFSATTLHTTGKYGARKRNHPAITVITTNDIPVPRLISAVPAVAEAIRVPGPGESRVVPVEQLHR